MVSFSVLADTVYPRYEPMPADVTRSHLQTPLIPEQTIK